jgi:hypothetical protein
MLRASKNRFKGVTWVENAQKYQVRICVKGKSIFLGNFDDATEGAERYDEAKMATGEYVKLNFPNTPAAVTARLMLLLLLVLLLSLCRELTVFEIVTNGTRI